MFFIAVKRRANLNVETEKNSKNTTRLLRVPAEHISIVLRLLRPGALAELPGPVQRRKTARVSNRFSQEIGMRKGSNHHDLVRQALSLRQNPTRKSAALGSQNIRATLGNQKRMMSLESSESARLYEKVVGNRRFVRLSFCIEA